MSTSTDAEPTNNEETSASAAPEASAEPKPEEVKAEPTPEQKLAEAKAEAAKYRDQLLRTAADFDNFRKRSRKELEDALPRGRESAIKDLLPVFDNLERAASSAGNATEAKAVADGLRIVLKQFTDTLEKMGVKRIGCVGNSFDPALHEAIQQVESAEHPAGVILHEVQAGYMIGDRLLRAAMVVVSKGVSGN